MISRRWERILWIASVLGMVAGLGGSVGGLHARERATTRGTALHLAPTITLASRDTIDSAAAATSDDDPFRLTREPSDVPYTPDRENAPPLPPPAPVPPIMLSGIVGPPWVALLEGVPGHTGSLIAAPGDTVSRAPMAMLMIRRVTRDTVLVAGTDTTWRLTVRQPWP